MGQFFDEISDRHAEWIQKQRLIFVASAPLDPNGKVNLSPKGYDCFRVISPNQVCYLELTGSGIETQSHIQENGRITVMFCAFDKAPKIMRLFGTGKVLGVNSPEYNTIFDAQYSPENCDIYNAKGIRAIILIDVFKVGTSCGWGVPYFEYLGPRDTLQSVDSKQTMEKFGMYWASANTHSLDGLPGMRHERMGPQWAVLSSEDRKTIQRFKQPKGRGGLGGSWWDLGYVLENVSLVAVAGTVGTVVGAAVTAFALQKRG
ncbi:hypothetical protein BGX29_008754 [Mortierella sp. GBA35]|nr:hypothetical protein BGX29_008754 [Mortierella sp. GBA35]